MTSRRIGRSHRPAVWLGFALAVPCLVSSLAAGWGLPGVVATGMCPPAPPDVAAYACSPAEYLLRMTFGPWALAGHAFLWCAWATLVAGAWLVGQAIITNRRRTVQPAAADAPSQGAMEVIE